MRNSRSYQLVSEHSILSAQRNDRIAAVEKILERKAQHNKQEWNKQLDNIKQRLEQRRRNRDDELSEKDFEIYLEMKLDWLQQFYVTAKSRKREEVPSQKHIDEWSEEMHSDLEHEGSNCRPPSTLENRMDTAEQRIGIVEVTMTKILKQLDEINANLKDLGSKKNREGRNDCGREDESGGDLDPPRKPVTTEAQREAESPEKPTLPETPDGGATLAEASPSINLGEILLSCESEVCVRKEKEERAHTDLELGGVDLATNKDPQLSEPPEPPDDAVAKTELKADRDLGARCLSLSTEGSDRFGRQSGGIDDWFLVEMGFWTDPEGQAPYMLFTPTQLLVSNSDLFDIKREVLKEKIKKENKLFGFGGSDISFNPMGQAHNFIITPPIFTNTGRELQVVDGLNNQRDQLFNSSLPLQKSQGVSINMEVEEIITSLGRNNSAFVKFEWPKSMVEHLIHIVESSRMTRAETYHRLWDPGELYSASCIIVTSCFQLWDPGGRLLTVCFCYLHLEDKVNV